jgi:hypothetical protein
VDDAVSRSPHLEPAMSASFWVGQQSRWLPDPAANLSCGPPAVSQGVSATVAPWGANPHDWLLA